jgi:hypothetical protein
MRLVPISIREANRYVLHHHRHHRPTQGALFALAAELNGELVGVAIVGRPVGRGLQDGRTVEVTRVCTDGTRNACSFLYGRCRRAAAALGYERVVTYTRQDESGASPRGAGFVQEELLAARSWADEYTDAADGKPRHDRSEPFARIRWSAPA